MSVFVYPPVDKEPWPTLGPQVCAWIEENLVYGPGDLLGLPMELDDETKGWIYKFYELFPKGHPKAGKRRFQRCALSLPKGSAKTEDAALITIAEAHPEAPVRFAGFSKNGELLDGQGVTDPYIPMIAYTEEQTEELAYGAVRRILEQDACSVGRDFDVGYERILRLDGHGKIEAVSTSPNARDGARTTFMHADETHRFLLPKQKQAWQVMLANLAKRPIADPWALETTTAPEPGAGSVAEATMLHAEELAKQKRESRLFFYHRQASDKHNLTIRRGRKAAIREARGPYKSAWSDIDRISELFEQPDADLAYLERVYTNRLIAGSDRAFDVIRWRELESDADFSPGEPIVLGFDGSRFDDATALIGCNRAGLIKPIRIWERPLNLQKWEVPIAEVDERVAATFETFEVVRMYCDPPMWESYVAKWAGRYGDKVVIEWWTNRPKPMAYACRGFAGAIIAGEISHTGDEQLTQHIGNARKRYTGHYDEQKTPLWYIQKERKDSPKKIDGAMGSILSWEAWRDAVSSGALGDVREPGDLGITVGSYG